MDPIFSHNPANDLHTDEHDHIGGESGSAPSLVTAGTTTPAWAARGLKKE